MTTWHWHDLVLDHQTGKIRETAVWSNIGKATMTFGFIFETCSGTLTEWFVAAYGGVVVMHEVAARVMNQKQQVIDKS
jgi:hypothetical protein